MQSPLEVDPVFLGDHEHETAIGSFVLTERRPVDVNPVELKMLNNQVSSTLCHYGGEPFTTAEVVRPNRRDVVFHTGGLLSLLSPALAAVGGG